MPYFGMGIIYYFKKNNAREGIKALKKSLELDPFFLKAYSALGCIYYDIGEYDKAIMTYQDAIARCPAKSQSAARYYNNIGIVYRTKGEYEKAILNFKKALAANPNFVEAKENLKKMGVPYLDEAEKLRRRFRWKGYKRG
jgi:tetratricopeptide (TPR) repeat protein